MTGPRTDAGGLFAAAEPWAILAASTLITACYKQNFSTITLLQGPVRCSGQVQGTLATIDLPAWFPAQEAVLELGGGILYAKLKDLPLPTRSQQIGEATRLQLDLQTLAIPSPPPTTVTLTYFPWFRFLSEPVNFDAMDRAAEYVAACFQFLLKRNKIGAAVSQGAELWRVAGDAGIVIDVHGARAVQKIVIGSDAMQTTFDLAGRRIAIDRRMFPVACAAGDEMLQTADRPRHMTVEASETHLVFAATKGG